MQTWHIFLIILMWGILSFLIVGIWITLKEINRHFFEKSLRQHEDALFQQIEEIRNDFS